MLILREKERVAILLWDGHGHDFLFHPAASDGHGRALLAPERKQILIFAPDVKLLSDVFAGFWHGINTILCFHQGVYETPAERGIFHFHGARIGAVGFGHDEGRSRHALNAPGNDEICLAAFDGPRGERNRVHTRTAEPVHGCARHFFRQTRQQESHPSDISIVFAGLIGAAVNDIVDGVPIDTGITVDQSLEGNRREIIGANRGQRSAVSPERRSNGVADVSSLHDYPWNFTAPRFYTQQRRRAKATSLSIARSPAGMYVIDG